MLNVSNFRHQARHETSSHGLKFEAYELPKFTVSSRVSSVSQASSTELVPVTEAPHYNEVQQAASLPSVQDAERSDLRLRLDGVQKKWGCPTYSSSVASDSNSSSQKTLNGIMEADGSSTSTSKARETSHQTKREQDEVSAEKQKLAASLFGGSSKPEKRPSSSHKAAKAAEKLHAGKTQTSSETGTEKSALQPQPDLLDLDGPSVTDVAPSVDPFQQLEGLIDSSDVNSTANPLPSATDDSSLMSELSNTSSKTAHGGTALTQPSIGPSPKHSLEKDALVRQMGVNPSSENPNLFRDLLG